MKRFLVCLSYDGSFFSGWQKQPLSRGLRTVQNTLEDCLTLVAKQYITTIGSSRTDTGVHALCQYTHFDFPIDMTERQLKLAVSAKLPKDIKINAVHIVPPDFHCRYDATGRSYLFQIAKDLTPFNRMHHSYFPRYRINTGNIRQVLHLFKGKKDFDLFCRKDESLNSYISEVREIDFIETDDGYTFSISANRFLHNMVRRIIGTLVKLSNNKDLLIIIEELLKNNSDYLHLIYTAPPQGLFLTKIDYPDSAFL